MPQAFGHQAWLGFEEEVSYGTPVAAANFIEILSESIKGEQSYIAKPALRSPSQQNRVKSKKGVSGSAVMQLPFEGAEIFFKHAFGSIVTTGAGPYTHTFTPASILPVGLTLAVNRDADALGGNSCWQYEGCQINKLTLRQEIEEILEAEFEFMGEDWSLISKPTPTFPTFKQIDWEMLTTAKIDPAGANVDLDLRRFELSIENALADDRYVLGSRLRSGLGRNGPRIVSGSFELELKDTTAYAYFQNLTTAPLRFYWVNGADQLQIDMPNVAFNGEDPSTQDAGPYTFTMQFEAYMNSAENDEITVALINTVSAP